MSEHSNPPLSDQEEDWETEESDESQKSSESSDNEWRPAWRKRLEAQGEFRPQPVFYLDDPEDEMSAWKTRLNGKRLVTSSAGFRTPQRRKIFHSAPDSAISLPSRPPTSRLLLLPLEIRQHILYYVLTPSKFRFGFIRYKNERGGTTDQPANRRAENPSSAVIFACKQLYNEGRKAALDAYTFKYEDLPDKKTIMSEKHRGQWDYSVK